jgi:UMP-CMP kinase
LVDGLPRNQENVDAWEKNMKNDVDVKGLIYFKCSDQVMEARLLERGKTSGRSDDNIETIKKRFDTFHKETEPVINDFHKKGLVIEVNAEKTSAEVYTELKGKLADKGVNPKPKTGNPPQVVFVLGGPGSGKGT